MYSTPSANEMSHYQQLLLQQQRQQHQSAQHQAMQQQQQQLLQQQAIAQAELRSRELNIQSATNHQQQGLSSLGHVQHQTGAVSSAQNSSNQFLNHTSSAMYSLPSAHLGSSGGTVTSINVTSVPNSSPNIAPHLTSMASSRGNMVPPSNNMIRTNSSSNNGMMPPPRSTCNNMLPPSAIPSARGGVKDSEKGKGRILKEPKWNKKCIQRLFLMLLLRLQIIVMIQDRLPIFWAITMMLLKL